jgi:hypothetical protein
MRDFGVFPVILVNAFMETKYGFLYHLNYVHAMYSLHYSLLDIIHFIADAYRHTSTQELYPSNSQMSMGGNIPSSSSSFLTSSANVSTSLFVPGNTMYHTNNHAFHHRELSSDRNAQRSSSPTSTRGRELITGAAVPHSPLRMSSNKLSIQDLQSGKTPLRYSSNDNSSSISHSFGTGFGFGESEDDLMDVSAWTVSQVKQWLVTCGLDALVGE